MISEAPYRKTNGFFDLEVLKTAVSNEHWSEERSVILELITHIQRMGEFAQHKRECISDVGNGDPCNCGLSSVVEEKP